MGRYSGADIPRLYLSARDARKPEERMKIYSEIAEYVEDELETLEGIYNSIIQEPFFKQLSELRRKADKRG